MVKTMLEKEIKIGLTYFKDSQRVYMFFNRKITLKNNTKHK